MAQDQSIKIRALPRKNEKPASQTETKPATTSQTPRWIIYVGTTTCAAIAGLFIVSKKAPTKPAVQQKEMASIQITRGYDSVNKHLQDTYLKHEMMIKARQNENMKVKNDGPMELSEDELDPSRIYGVTLDQENTAERIYEDLNGTARSYADSTPDEKINNRLANRRWVNDLERAERIQFVKNFLRSAYEKGYEVQLDENLKVVGVKKINETRKVNIDQVIDRMAKQGL